MFPPRTKKLVPGELGARTQRMRQQHSPFDTYQAFFYWKEDGRWKTGNGVGVGNPSSVVPYLGGHP